MKNKRYSKLLLLTSLIGVGLATFAGVFSGLNKEITTETKAEDARFVEWKGKFASGWNPNPDQLPRGYASYIVAMNESFEAVDKSNLRDVSGSGDQVTLNGTPITGMHGVEFSHAHSNQYVYLNFPKEMIVPAEGSDYCIIHINEGTLFDGVKLRELTIYADPTTYVAKIVPSKKISTNVVGIDPTTYSNGWFRVDLENYPFVKKDDTVDYNNSWMNFIDKIYINGDPNNKLLPANQDKYEITYNINGGNGLSFNGAKLLTPVDKINSVTIPAGTEFPNHVIAGQSDYTTCFVTQKDQTFIRCGNKFFEEIPTNVTNYYPAVWGINQRAFQLEGFNYTEKSGGEKNNHGFNFNSNIYINKDKNNCLFESATRVSTYYRMGYDNTFGTILAKDFNSNPEKYVTIPAGTQFPDPAAWDGKINGKVYVTQEETTFGRIKDKEFKKCTVINEPVNYGITSFEGLTGSTLDFNASGVDATTYPLNSSTPFGNTNIVFKFRLNNTAGNNFAGSFFMSSTDVCKTDAGGYEFQLSRGYGKVLYNGTQIGDTKYYNFMDNFDYDVEIYVIKTDATHVHLAMLINGYALVDVVRDCSTDVLGTINSAKMYTTTSSPVTLKNWDINEEALALFCEKGLKMSDESATSENYLTAKDYLENCLTETQKELFYSDSKYESALTRYLIWAEENGDSQDTFSKFTGVNADNNNVFIEEEGAYSTMLQFSAKFAAEDKSNINIATSESELGNKMTLNGTPIKNIPGFFASYKYNATEGSTIWFKVPEDFFKTLSDTLISLSIPAGTLIYDAKTLTSVSLMLIDGIWVNSLKQSEFLGVNKYNNNNYEEDKNLYKTMLEFSIPFADSNKSEINIATASDDLGKKMTLNGVPVKDIPGFFASYYDAGKDGPMLLFKIPASYIAPSNGYNHTTIFLPKGTIIYDCVTKNAVNIFLNNGKWMIPGKWAGEPEPIDDYDYSFAVVPDTQDINYSVPNDYHKIYDWIVDNKDSKKIAHTIGLGDITEKNAKEEWDRARESFDKLEEAGMTHTQVRGNHDMRTEFDNFFKDDAYYNQGIEETFENMSNCYRKFRVGNTDYLILALDYEPSNAALDWANKVVENHPYHNVILVTHGYLYRDGTTLSPGDDLCPAINNGEDIWNKLARKHKNITMVLSGHVYCDNILVSTQIGDYGNKVTQVLIDPQQMDREGTKTGAVAMLYFSNNGKNVQFEYYSTLMDLYETTSANKKITIDRIAPLCTNHNYVEHVAVNPTCTEDGNIKYFTCSNEDCEKIFIENELGEKVEVTMEDVVLPAHHTLDTKPVFNFSNDGETATVTFECSVCHKTLTEEATVTSSLTKKPTCTEDGEKTYIATYGDYTDSKVVVVPATGHNDESVEHILAQAPTCTVPGHKEAYFCNDCENYYEDEALTKLIGDENAYKTWINGEGKTTKQHTFIEHDAVPGTCVSTGTKAYYECSECHQYFASNNAESLIGNADDLANWLSDPNGGLTTIDEHNHTSGYTKHNAVASTCTKEGNIEYYTCDDCGAYIVKNGDVMKEVTENEIKLPLDLSNHSLTFVDEIAATYENDGVKAHYVCDECGKCFILSGDTWVEQSEGDLIIPKLTLVTPEPEKGCGGSIIAASAFISIVSIVGVGLISIRKRKED